MIYEEAMAAEFRRRKVPYEVQRNTEVFYKGEEVGTHRLKRLLTTPVIAAAISIGVGFMSRQERARPRGDWNFPPPRP